MAAAAGTVPDVDRDGPCSSRRAPTGTRDLRRDCELVEILAGARACRVRRLKLAASSGVESCNGFSRAHHRVAGRRL
jgi:hypothetical protein